MKKIFHTLLFLVFTFLSFAQNALDFDGSNDYVSMTSPGPTGTSDRTVECWIKTTASQQSQQVIVDWGSAAPLGSRFTLNMLAFGKIRIEVGGNGFNSTQSIADGNWHHVAVTYDHSASIKVRMYIDGVLEASNNFTQSVNTSTSGIRLGRRVDGVNYFDGLIDEVRIWNVVRTASEISSSMNGEFCSAIQGLVAYYKFNQGTAGGNNTTVTTLNDLAGTNNGTLNSFSLTGSSSNWVTGKSLTAGNTQDSITVTACDSYTPPSGNATWTTSGNYIDTATTSTGCDSILFIDLTVKANSTGSMTATGCNSYTSPSGNNTWTTSGTYTDIVPNAVGCDSVITINLTINTVDTNVLVNNATLTSWQAGANYQWLDCDNGYAPVSGATGQTFTATANGNYAVEIDWNGCVDTSACYAINGIGIDENPLSSVDVYPNPATNHVTIAFHQPLKTFVVELLDVTGKTIFSEQFSNASRADVKLDLPAGIYMLKLTSEQHDVVKRLSIH